MKNKNKFILISPCYNESLGIEKFLIELENNLKDSEHSFIVVLVDDASKDNTAEIIRNFSFGANNLTLVLHQLKSNHGHQEAIRQGLKYANLISKENNAKGVIVMDSDGEDDPKAIHELTSIEKFDITFVTRGKRKESLAFKIGYFFYKIVFRLLTGNSISFGNYSIINTEILNEVANANFIHYAAFLNKQKINIIKIKFDRKSRIAGKSKMNYKSLVFHGLYSLVEYSEEVLFTLIKLLCGILLVLGVLGVYVMYTKYYTEKAISGWASIIGINLIICCLVLISTIVIGLFLLSLKKMISQQKLDNE